MEIEFGVMSNRWRMEAEDIKVGKIAMCLFISRKIPIAIYKPEESGFMPSMEFIKENIDYKRSSVIKAQNSIKIIRKQRSKKNDK